MEEIDVVRYLLGWITMVSVIPNRFPYGRAVIRTGNIGDEANVLRN